MRHEAFNSPVYGKQNLVFWEGIAEQVDAVKAFVARLPYYRNPDGSLYRDSTGRTHQEGAPVSFPTTAWEGGPKCDSWDDIERAIKEPYLPALEAVDLMADRLRAVRLPAPRSIKRTNVWSSEDGDDFSYDRYRAGQDFFRGPRRRAVYGPRVISLLVHIGGNGGETYWDMLWRGAACVVMAEILENQGYRTEVITYDIGVGLYTDGSGEFQCVWVKRAHDPFDKATLVNAVSCWYFRTVNFGGFRLTPGVRFRAIGAEMTMTDDLGERVGADARWVVHNVFDFDRAVALCRQHLKTLADEEKPVAAAGVGAW